MRILNVILLALVFITVAFTSCGPNKKVHQARLYVRGIDTSQTLALKVPEPVIQKSDILSIVVFSDNPEATALFNQPIQNSGGGSPGAGAASATAGYLVDVNGDIYFHSLGRIHVGGLTKHQVTELIKEKLGIYLKNAYVEIRFLNARVTMLGELARPGTINIPEQRISILDAIALSGDLTNYGRRDNVLVIREKDGKREIARLNLQHPDIFQSDYFYLQQNDLVYVEPIQKKPTGNDILLRNVTIATSIVSMAAILITLFQ